MIKKIEPTVWSLFVSYEGADQLKQAIAKQSFIDAFEYDDVVDGTYGLRFSLHSKMGSVAESTVDTIIKDYMEAAE
jgi:nucleotide-binding universal stress UspA family protein